MRRAHASLARRIGRDVTQESARRSALVLAPHPDDEVLGCGASILRKRASGVGVHVIFATDGRHSHRSGTLTPAELAAIRRGEAEEACRRLGLSDADRSFLGHEDGTLEAHGEELVAALAERIAASAPAELLVPSGWDAHPDHRALYRGALAARARAGAKCRVYAYPVWTGALWQPLVHALWRRPALVEIGAFREPKRHALAAHRSQTTNLTGEPDWAWFDDGFLADFFGPWEIFHPAG